MAEDSFALFALARVVERDAVADGAGDEFGLENAFANNPFFIDGDQFGLIPESLLESYLFLLPLLHNICYCLAS